MATLNLKPTHAPVKAYYEALQGLGRGNFDNEGNIRSAFERLLEKCVHQFDWTVVPEYPIARKGQHPIRADAGLIDAFNLPRGYWEAKDSKDDLKAEIHKKFEAGYPRTNILFQSPAHAILYQNGLIAFATTSPARKGSSMSYGSSLNTASPTLRSGKARSPSFLSRSPT
jgi:hypothetical protein